jgi:hypothetical protein
MPTNNLDATVRKTGVKQCEVTQSRLRKTGQRKNFYKKLCFLSLCRLLHHDPVRVEKSMHTLWACFEDLASAQMYHREHQYLLSNQYARLLKIFSSGRPIVSTAEGLQQALGDAVMLRLASQTLQDYLFQSEPVDNLSKLIVYFSHS